jgi:5-methylcytosine-specific restriction endonuclease McrA
LRILRLNKAGQAMQWIGPETAACLIANQRVIWSYGDICLRLHGGISQQLQRQSILEIPPIIATAGEISTKTRQSPKLTNLTLFQRDQFICLYCGKQFYATELTRDHVIPKGSGGKDTWNNCVSACKPCNNVKGCRTPEAAQMKLLAIPFKPNICDYLALANRHILADQMEFLVKGFSRHMQTRRLTNSH